MTSEVTQADRKAIDRAEAFAKSKHTTPDEHDDIMVAVRLARLTTQSGEGDDPRRILKNALFALEKLKAPAMIYGGVLTEGGKRAWLEYSLREQGDYSVFSGEGRSGAGEDLGDLEWTEDGYSLRTKYDGDVDGDGRHIVVGGDLIVTFDDSEIADEYRERIIAALNARQSGEGERLREAAAGVLAHRVDGPTRGWLRDNRDSRAALDALAAALRATNDASKA